MTDFATLTGKDNTAAYGRVRGMRMCCALSRWDREGELPALCEVKR